MKREPTILVVVTVHDAYEKYLRACLRTLDEQTLRPTQIKVVANGMPGLMPKIVKAFSHGDRPPISYETMSTTNVCVKRNAAAADWRGDYLLFVDADNLLTPDYLKIMVAALEKNPAVAVAYPDVHVFEDGTENVIKRSQKRSWCWERQLVSNEVESCSLIRTRDFHRVGGFDPNIHGFMDWDMWCRMLRPDSGCIAVRTDAVLLYRKHGENMSDASHKNHWGHKLRVAHSRKAVFVPFSGRPYCLEPAFRFLRTIDYPTSQLALYLYDNSSPASPSSERIREFAAEAMASWGKVVYHRDTVQLRDVMAGETEGNDDLLATDLGTRAHMGKAMSVRTAAIFNWMRDHVAEEMVLTVEDDNEPEPDALRKLLAGFLEEHVMETWNCPAAIGGYYYSRFRRLPLVSREKHERSTGKELDYVPMWPPEAGEPDVQRCDMTGFGTTLLFMPILKLSGIRFRHYPVTEDYRVFGTDNAAGWDFRRFKRTQWVHWGVPVKHWLKKGKYLACPDRASGSRECIVVRVKEDAA